MFTKTSRPAFSIIELLLVLAIVAIIGSTIFTSVWLYQGRGREKFVAHLNALMRLSWQQTMITNKVHRLVFEFKKHRVRLERAAEQTKKGEHEFVPVRGAFVSSSFSWNSAIDIKQFIIDGQDKIAKSGTGHNTVEAWFYIVPGGLSQSVTINLIEQQGQRKRPIGLVLNVFNAQFKEYDSFQK